jgi:hypothetical protein
MGPNCTYTIDGKTYSHDEFKELLLKDRDLFTKYVGGNFVPTAPFKSTWHELAMKRMLRYAAEHGYDKLSWDTGETQTARYDLGNHLDRIEYEPAGEGRFEVHAYDKGNRRVIEEDDIDLKRVEDLFGKDIAKKIEADEGERVNEGGYRDWRALKGLDLKVGGEGMRGFYDRILPQFVNKYAKKWGAKVENTKISGNESLWEPYERSDGTWSFRNRSNNEVASSATFPSRSAVLEAINREGHSIDITPAMRESVMQGQPLFENKEPLSRSFVTAPPKGEYKDLTAEVDKRIPPRSGPEELRSYLVDRGKDTGTESLIMRDHATGETVHAGTVGAANTVDITPEMAASMSKPGAEMVVHHNHPSSSSLSPGDLRAFRYPGMKAIFAYAHNGDYYGASLTPETSASLHAETRLFGRDMKLNSIITSAENALYNRLKKLVNAGTISRQMANRWWAHMVNTALDRAGILHYVSNAELPGELKSRLDMLIGKATDNARKQAQELGIEYAAAPDRSAQPLRLEEGSERLLGKPERVAGEAGSERGAPEGQRNLGGHPGLAEDSQPFDRMAQEQERQRKENLFDKLSSAPDPSLGEVLAAHNLSLMDRLKMGASPAVIQETTDRWRTALQDKFLPLLRVQNAIETQFRRKLAEDENPYLTEELSTGRKGAKLEDLSENMVRPLVEGMHQAGVTVPELEAFLYARHAPERNARIAKINPEFRGDMLKEEGAGSGMTDAEAATIMDAAKQSGKLDQLQALAKQVDDILDFAMKERVDSGLLSRADADKWRATYKNYVPLRGDPMADPELGAERPRTGQGINIRGKESQMAFGRRTKARDILPYVIMQAEEAILRGEKNRVAQAFVKLAEGAKEPDFWKVNKLSKRRVFDKRTGEVRTETTDKLLAEDKDYTVSAKIDGQEHRVTMSRHNPAAVRLARSMRSLDEDQLRFVVRFAGSITRFLSTVNTSFNPEFVISNAFRDLQEATFNLGQHGLKGLRRGVLRDYLPALKASLQHEFGHDKGKWSEYAHEFRANGGRVYFNRMDDIASQRHRLETAFRDAKPGASARKAIKAVFQTVERVNNGVENGIRLAAYKNAREAGLSPARAASLAKNLTINFNRRGTYGPLMNSFYMFFNASMQGTATMLHALRSPAVRKLMYGAVATGAALEVMNSMSSQKDKDGQLFYDKISDYDKNHNLIIMDPTSDKGAFFKIPLPYGYGTFFNVGRSGVELYRGKRFSDVMSSLVSSTVDAFNPVGGTGSILNFLAPTVADPIVDLVRNRDYADRPIMPDQKQFGPEVPQNQRYWNSVSPVAKDVTDFLNKISGGDEVRPGAIDVSPEVLEYMFGQATGAAGSFYLRNADLWQKMTDPAAEFTWNDVPFARRLVGAPSKSIDRSLFYDRAQEVDQQLAYLKAYRKNRDPEGARAFVKQEQTLLSLSNVANRARTMLSKINKDKAAIRLRYDRNEISKDSYQQSLDRFNAASDRIISGFNKLYIEKGLEPGQTPTPKPATAPAQAQDQRSALPAPNLKAALQTGNLTRYAASGATWSREDAIQAATDAGQPETAALLREARYPLRPDLQDRLLKAA